MIQSQNLELQSQEEMETYKPKIIDHSVIGTSFNKHPLSIIHQSTIINIRYLAYKISLTLGGAWGCGHSGVLLRMDRCTGLTASDVPATCGTQW